MPGAFDAWARLARDYGTMPLAELMEPALGYAENGYPLVGRIRDTIMTVAELFRHEWTTSAAVYLPGGNPPTPGKLFRNPALAATYRRVLAESEAGGGSREHRIERARDAWYNGFVAETIDRFCRTQQVLDASGRRHGGVLTADDMARWQAPVEAPLTYDYRGYTVVKGGPWSQGPVMLQQLALLQGFDLDGLDPVGPEFVHIVTECAKLAYADREAWYGDPDFVDVPMATLLSRDYNDAQAQAGRRARLARSAAGQPRRARALCAGRRRRRCGRRPGLASRPSVRWAASASRRPANSASSPATPAISTSSTAGATWSRRRRRAAGCKARRSSRNSASASARGCRSPGSTSVRPPSLAPGKRPRSTLSPTLALKDGEPCMAFGTPGGDGQDQWSTQLFLHHVHHGMNLQEAIDCPEFNNDHAPSSFYPRAANPGGLALEGRFPHETARALAERGHKVRIGETWSGGRLTACAREANPRRHRSSKPAPTRAACRPTRSGGESANSGNRPSPSVPGKFAPDFCTRQLIGKTDDYLPAQIS